MTFESPYLMKNKTRSSWIQPSFIEGTEKEVKFPIYGWKNIEGKRKERKSFITSSVVHLAIGEGRL